MQLVLQKSIDGSVTVKVIRGGRIVTNLVTFYRDGRIKRHPGVTRNLGFKLDDQRRIKIYGD